MKLSTEKNIIPKIQKYLATQPVVRAWLFGSFSRGEETPSSDLDILFVPDKTQHFSLFTLGGMYSDLKELLGREVDLVEQSYLVERESELLQFAYAVKPLHLFHRVVAVAGPFVHLVRLQKSFLLIVSQGFHCHLHHL